MKNDEFRQRTRDSALLVIRLCASLPSKRGVGILRDQLLRSSGSVAADAREASRARSRAGFVSNVEVCAQEADASLLWLERPHEGYRIDNETMREALGEADQDLATLTLHPSVSHA